MNGEILETSAVKSYEFLQNIQHLSSTGQKLHQEIFQRCQIKNVHKFSRFASIKPFFNRL